MFLRFKLTDDSYLYILVVQRKQEPLKANSALKNLQFRGTAGASHVADDGNMDGLNAFIITRFSLNSDKNWTNVWRELLSTSFLWKNLHNIQRWKTPSTCYISPQSSRSSRNLARGATAEEQLFLFRVKFSLWAAGTISPSYCSVLSELQPPQRFGSLGFLTAALFLHCHNNSPVFFQNNLSCRVTFVSLKDCSVKSHECWVLSRQCIPPPPTHTHLEQSLPKPQFKPVRDFHGLQRSYERRSD